MRAGNAPAGVRRGRRSAAGWNVRTLGVDPGTVATGWGAVEEKARSTRYLASGVIRARGPLPARLRAIFEQLREIVAAYRPAIVALERTFVGENVQSAFRLGEARGVILAAADIAGLRVVEYSPAEVKVAVTGGGRAGKDEVERMVRQLLGLNEDLAADEADALAVALCHLHAQRFHEAVGQPISLARRPMRRSAGILNTRRR